jgi:uncharacterized membrane protein YfcA
VTANVTNSIAVLPGYAGGEIGYREELRGQRSRIVPLAVTAALGGLAGAIVLLSTPAEAFDAIVPFLILGSCLLLLAQPAVERRLGDRRDGRGHATALHGAQFVAGI